MDQSVWEASVYQAIRTVSVGIENSLMESKGLLVSARPEQNTVRIISLEVPFGEKVANAVLKLKPVEISDSISKKIYVLEEAVDGEYSYAELEKLSRSFVGELNNQQVDREGFMEFDLTPILTEKQNSRVDLLVMMEELNADSISFSVAESNT